MIKLRSLPATIKSILADIPANDYPVMNSRRFFEIWFTYVMDKGITSLRDLFYQLNKTGTKVDLTTFSKANKTRGHQCFISVYEKLLSSYRQTLNKSEAKIICPFDSTTISLTSKLFWAEKYHQVKLLTSVNYETKTPSEIMIHFGQEHDMKFGEMILSTIPENGVGVGDRGFASKELFEEYIKSNVSFVIRISSNWKIGKAGCIEIKQEETKEVYKIRVVQFCDLETQKEYRIATNIEVMSNEEISDIYRKRWEIEVLWKFLKMHLKLDRLASKSRNGVTIQIYMVLIAYLILKWIEIPKVYGVELLDKLRYMQIVIRQESNFICWMNQIASVGSDMKI